MEPPLRPLILSRHEIPDPCYARGRRHPLAAMRALVCVAMRCGYRSYRAMAEWGRGDGQKLVHALGFTRPKTPCAATLSHVLSVRSHRVGLTMWPQAVADKTQEIPVLADVWPGVVVAGWVMTVDALLTPRAIAQRIVADGGDDVMVAKAKQPRRPQKIHRLFQDVDAWSQP